MHPAKKYIFIVAILLLAGCKNKADLDEKGIPSTLVIAAFVGEGPEEFSGRFTGVAEYMEKKLGMDVDMILTTDYTALIEALRSKKVHVVYMSPFAYVLSHHRGDFKPIITIGEKGQPYTYKSIIITHKNSGLKTIADIKANA